MSKTTAPTPPLKTVVAALKANKSLTEAEALEAVPGCTRPQIREAREKLGIGRQTALAWAKAEVAKRPDIPSAEIIDGVAKRFGVRLGAPDVSRMRPNAGSIRKAKAAKKTNGEPPKVAGLATPTAKMKAATKAIALVSDKQLGKELKQFAKKLTTATEKLEKKAPPNVTFAIEGPGEDVAKFLLAIGR